MLNIKELVSQLVFFQKSNFYEKFFTAKSMGGGKKFQSRFWLRVVYDKLNE